MERVFVFDAYGTLFDLASLQPHVEARCPGYGAVITQLWRLKQLDTPGCARSWESHSETFGP